MIIFREFVTLTLIVALAIGNPLGSRVPKIALVNGVPYLLNAVDGDSDQTTVSEGTEEGQQSLQEESLDSSEETVNQPLSNLDQKRSALRLAIARRSHDVQPTKTTNQDLPPRTMNALGKLEKYTPALSVGSMMNLQDFFDGLKGNVDMLESRVTPEELRALSSITLPVESFRSVSQYVEDSSSHIRPTANAAYLHALRMYRPSPRIRSLVDHHPEQFRGSNNFKPSYLWTGLG